MHKRNKFFLIALAFVFIFKGLSAAEDQKLPKLIMFHSASCHRCIEIKQKLMPQVEIEFRNLVSFEYRDTNDIENYKMLLALLQKDGKGVRFEVPLFYLGGKFLSPSQNIETDLRKFIMEGISRQSSGQGNSAIDLVGIFKGFVPAAIVIAGLEDGINPCAFTVIVFFVSFLALQGYRKKELILIGSAFIFSVFLTYLCIGLGIFNFFYRFRGFWLVSRIFNLVVGLLSVLFGILALYDFIKFKKTGSTEGLALQLPAAVKNRIHRTVGFFYRKNASQLRPGMLKLTVSALITGFLVSLLEAVCTGQVYLPTISFVLKTTGLKLQAFTYLLLYNIMFVIPLIVIFIFALLGTTSAQFSGFLKKRLGLIKLFMAVLFFGLGAFLIWGV